MTTAHKTAVRSTAVAQLAPVQVAVTPVVVFVVEKQEASALHTKCRKPNCG
jgi:hypothetical protein